jgi:hypothetical protein
LFRGYRFAGIPVWPIFDALKAGVRLLRTGNNNRRLLRAGQWAQQKFDPREHPAI